MGIDITVGIVLIITFIIGYRQGLIMSIFSVASYLVGFFAAMYFSFVVANYINANFNIPEQWIPLIAFIFLFTTVIFIVRFLGKFIEKLVNTLLPTLFNRLAGSALWMLIGILSLSLLIQLIDRTNVFTEQLKEASIFYGYLEESSTLVTENLADAIPFIKSLYQTADEYFKGVANQIEIQ